MSLTPTHTSEDPEAEAAEWRRGPSVSTYHPEERAATGWSRQDAEIRPLAPTHHSKEQAAGWHLPGRGTSSLTPTHDLPDENAPEWRHEFMSEHAAGNTKLKIELGAELRQK